MKLPQNPLSHEAHEHLRNKVKHMKGHEREKTMKRLEAYDRGYKKKKDNWSKEVEVDASDVIEAKLRRQYEKRNNRQK